MTDDYLTPELEAGLDRLLAAGVSRADVLAFCEAVVVAYIRGQVLAQGGAREGLTVCAIEAYIDRPRGVPDGGA